ncbi:uncharacterized protein LAJ45_00976 [Morchella importuna]|uniref:uncharacterized protein n=1 Tax=Morchella importuna TaxID=1174673 RepID=UPI001E8CDBC2|nr:uncharacterized protein LAJ45_00976 [Morchella importuna]KAH8154449.1 hypothetical protein LAJ45_00976 [Morchella importuna]
MSPQRDVPARMGIDVNIDINKPRAEPAIASHESDDAEFSWTKPLKTPVATRDRRNGKAIPQYITTPTEDEYSDCDDYHQYLRSEAEKRQAVKKVDVEPTTTTTPKKKKKGKAKASVKPSPQAPASKSRNGRVGPRHATAPIADEYEDFDDYHEYLRVTHTKPKATPGSANSQYIPPPKINVDLVKPGRIHRSTLPPKMIMTSPPKLPSERTYDEFDQQTLCGIGVDSEVSIYNVNDDHTRLIPNPSTPMLPAGQLSASTGLVRDYDHTNREQPQIPQLENINPSLTMTQKAKLESGWQPAHKLLSRSPSYPGKVYRPQPRSGPRPQGRTFQKLKLNSQLRTFQHMRLLHGSRNGSRTLGPSSWSSPYVPLLDRPSALVSERPIHRALRRAEENNSVHGGTSMVHLAAEYMKAELFPSDRETENDSLYSKSSGGPHSHTECEAETESLRPVISKGRCRGQQALKCKCRKAVAVVKRATVGGKVRLRKLLRT